MKNKQIYVDQVYSMFKICIISFKKALWGLEDGRQIMPGGSD